MNIQAEKDTLKWNLKDLSTSSTQSIVVLGSADSDCLDVL